MRKDYHSPTTQTVHLHSPNGENNYSNNNNNIDSNRNNNNNNNNNNNTCLIASPGQPG